jgi:hypothetical protein
MTMTPTEKEIITICDWITAEIGIQGVTYSAVKRARDGKGSYSTIGDGIRKWRKLRQIPGKTKRAMPYSHEEDVVLEAWQKAKKAIEDSASEQIEHLQNRCEELSEESRQLRSSLVGIERILDQVLKTQIEIKEALNPKGRTGPENQGGN